MPQLAAPPAGPLPDYRFPLEQQKPRIEDGGTARAASAGEFPVSVGIAGVSLRLVAYAPMGYGDCIQSTGEESCEMLHAFDSGGYQEVGLSAWLAGNTEEVVATNLGLNEEVARRLPADETFISRPPRAGR
jgi:oxalate decarboxylase